MIQQKSPLIAAAKKAVGLAAAELIEEGMYIGLGTGTTAAYFIEALAERCRAGLKIYAVASSHDSQRQAYKAGIPLIDPQTITQLDITVDGADEIDPYKNMIKGKGGALFREKLLAKSSREMIVMVDETKLVDQLGECPVPIEISSYIYKTTLQRLDQQNYQGVLRLNHDHTPYQTEGGNYIFDIQFNHPITDPQAEDERLRHITGVLETGIFFQVAGRVIIGYEDGLIKIQA